MSTALRLLILEDNPYDAELEVAVLQEAGYDCQWERVETQADFLAHLDAPDYDLILADYSLLAFDGLTALELFLERDLDLPFIFVSGILGEETAIESLKAGATDYVLKSHLSRLGPVVRRALREKEEHRQRKRVEEALQESEERFRRIFEEGPLGMAILSLEDRFIRVNAALCRLTGYTEEELIGSTWFDITHPEDVDIGKQQARQLLSGELPYLKTEKRYVTKEGQTLWVNLTAFFIHDGEGTPLYKLTMIEDITEHKQAEEALRRVRREWEDIFQAIGHPTLILDPQHNVIAANRAATRAIGSSEEELRGQKCYQVLHGTDRPPEGCPLEKMLISGELETVEMEIEALGGTFLVSCTPVLDEAGRLQKVIHIATDITKRKRAEERLRLLSSAVEQSTEGVAVSDLEGNLLFVNNAFAAMHGYTPEELVGEHLSIFHTPEQMPSVEAVNRQIRETGEFSGEVWHVRRDGTVFPSLMHNSLLRDEAGNPVGMIGTLRDITERKQAEEEVRRLKEFNESMIQNMAEGIIVEDVEGYFTFVNPAAAALLGYTPQELVGRHWTAVVPSDQQPVVRAADERRARGEADRYELEVMRKDGTRLSILVSGSPRFEEGRLVGTLAVFTNITEHKRMERLLWALNGAALAMERALTPEEIFAAVAEEFKKLGFTCAVFLTNEDQSRLLPTYLSYGSPAIKATEKLISLQREGFSMPIEAGSVWGEVVWERKAVFVDDAEDVLRQVLPDFARKFAGQVMKILKIRKSILAPFIVEDEVIGVFSVQSDDLTENNVPAITAFAHQMAVAWRKAQLMQDLQNSLEELKRTQAQLIQAQKMEALGHLAAGIAHDFNNLLTPIGGFAELLLWKAPQGSQQQEYLRQIKAAAERAAALTRQLRLFTRQTKGERRPVQLNNVVEETYKLLERSLPKEIIIELHLEPELWVVEADPSQIGQVLMNLCLNARDAMPDGGTLTLETRNLTLDEEYVRTVPEVRPGRYVRLTVSDTGCGMSPEVQARLFEPFFTTKRVGEGTGLGLAVVYGIVKGHDGFIQVYSEEGRGSTFHVYLPATGSAAGEAEVEEAELPAGTETIMVVDDEELVRVLGQSVLQSCGYTVLVAGSGVQALEVYQARREEIALVVLDVVMPEMGGRECLRRLREIDPRVKVLISTGYTARGLAEELVAEGALGVVEKPFLLRDFVTAVRVALDR